MAGKAQMRREALKDTLITIAQKRIAADGIASIKARDLAQEAGCAVGAIYNVFGDLNDIIMAGNGRTLQLLRRDVATSLLGMENATPTARLVSMSMAYLDFASTHTQSWQCLFDLQMSTDKEVPEWYLAELDKLFGDMSGPVRECFADMDEADVALMTRALFSSVHGIVLLGLQTRISAVPRPELKRMISLVLRNATGSR